MPNRFKDRLKSGPSQLGSFASLGFKSGPTQVGLSFGSGSHLVASTNCFQRSIVHSNFSM